MEISEAFTQEAIAAAGTDVDGEEEAELRAMVKQICTANQVELTEEQTQITVLCFVAGRTNQAGNREIKLGMSIQLAEEFMEFLVQRGMT